MQPTKTAFARLPTYTALIDGLASGLGLVRNKEDALANLNSFGGRIDAYSGLRPDSGLQEKILELLAGEDSLLRENLKHDLLEVETILTQTRSIPLVTNATEQEGLRQFFDIWALPWIAQILVSYQQHRGSVLDSARLLIEAHVAASAKASPSYLETWKAMMRQAIPEAANAPEFRLKLTKLDKRSQRKKESIDEDLAKLRTELKGSVTSEQELNAIIETVRGLYLAGMATMRLCATAAVCISEADIFRLLGEYLVSIHAKPGMSLGELAEKQMDTFWRRLDPKLTYHHAVKALRARIDKPSAEHFQKLRTKSLEISPGGLLLYVIDYEEGRWHLSNGANDLAEKCFQSVVEQAGKRQLGNIAAMAASMLVALRLSEPRGFKHEELNPLIRVRIENMWQTTEILILQIPTPFGDWTPLPEVSFYDKHLMQSVALFSKLQSDSGITSNCNPLQQFDRTIESLITRSRQAATKLAEAERNRPAITGTSIKPYELLKWHLFFRDALFELNESELPNLDDYARLSEDDQRRVLRFVDPAQFQNDLETYNLVGWQHPEDGR